ncbi:MAG: ribonuclease H-like domain-containing protein [Alphaproteobacteria bacterium]|nr:ribonuclease H-like domain-containing protein [Alphaproteobacteria bacterium]
MKIQLYKYDLPDNLIFSESVAIDTEAMGLKNHRDRLCLVQISSGDGECHLVQFERPNFERALNLKKLLQNQNVTKIFHYARFDVAIMMHSFGIKIENIYCTKIASRLVRTFTDKHSLKDLCKELLSVEISKQEGTSDWGASDLTKDQLRYAATDVLHLHKLKNKLDDMLKRENRVELAKACFDFLPYRAQMDLLGGEAFDVFPHRVVE